MNAQSARKFVKDHGVKYLLAQFVDIHGSAKAKAVPAAHLDMVLSDGAGFAGFAIWGMGMGPHGPDYMAVGDPSTLSLMPWMPGYARIACDGHVHGKPYPYCSRVALKAQLAKLEQRGLTLYTGIEPEFMLLKRGPDGRLAPCDDSDTLDKPCYDFNVEEVSPEDVITPKSRTFIPSRITNNPFLHRTGYMSQLQALPEPLRSQMLRGDFTAGTEDPEYQVIPTAWVKLAQDRWQERLPKPRMDSMGVDVARGGKDNTIISRRHGWWFDKLITEKGTETPDGPIVAGMVVRHRRDAAPVHIDVIGVGASPYDFLVQARVQTIGVDARVTTHERDRSGMLTFANHRSWMWWRFRELLDPQANLNIALPPDPRLLRGLCAPLWSPSGKVITVESRDEIIARIGFSPDEATAVLLAALETPRLEDLPGHSHNPARNPIDYDPYASHGVDQRQLQDYDPYA